MNVVYRYVGDGDHYTGPGYDWSEHFAILPGEIVVYIAQFGETRVLLRANGQIRTVEYDFVHKGDFAEVK